MEKFPGKIWVWRKLLTKGGAGGETVVTYYAVVRTEKETDSGGTFP